MKRTQVSCDRCGCVFTIDGSELEIGRADCVRVKADLCKACATLFYAWLGETWRDLRDQDDR